MNAQLQESGGKVRLYVEAALAEGAHVEASQGHAHYLLHVMRAKAGDRVSLFNGRDGEWLARVDQASKRGCVLVCEKRTRAQTPAPDLWLCFAPIKKTPADYVVQKATELGVSVLQPVITRRTIVSRVNLERMRANAIEAAEQSDRLDVPEVREPVSLDKLLANWPAGRRLLFCDEGGDAEPIAEALSKLEPPLPSREGANATSEARSVRGRGHSSITPPPNSSRGRAQNLPPPARGGGSKSEELFADKGRGAPPALTSMSFAILTGPEGGFDPAERDLIREHGFVLPVSLGPRILRADTAALAALAVSQALAGDWK
ncbi:MAG TPA: 16S rRNA (uracil(1498)-N(3))-methyltransferase [Rhizomicrobium sp.]|jgi:16S rRNA (uracil1498-N3)-methyltransferase